MNLIHLNCGMKKFINSTWPLGYMGSDPRKVLIQHFAKFSAKFYCLGTCNLDVKNNVEPLL